MLTKQYTHTHTHILHALSHILSNQLALLISRHMSPPKILLFIHWFMVPSRRTMAWSAVFTAVFRAPGTVSKTYQVLKTYLLNE